MKFSDIKGERALDVICELIEPIANIAADESAADIFQTKEKPEGQTVNDFIMNRLKKAYPALLKNHRADLIKIAACINDCSEEEYTDSLSMKKILNDLADLISDPYFRSFFVSVPTPSGKESSGNTAENTKAKQ